MVGLTYIDFVKSYTHEQVQETKQKITMKKQRWIINRDGMQYIASFVIKQVAQLKATRMWVLEKIYNIVQINSVAIMNMNQSKTCKAIFTHCCPVESRQPAQSTCRALALATCYWNRASYMEEREYIWEKILHAIAALQGSSARWGALLLFHLLPMDPPARDFLVKDLRRGYVVLIIRNGVIQRDARSFIFKKRWGIIVWRAILWLQKIWYPSHWWCDQEGG